MSTAPTENPNHDDLRRGLGFSEEIALLSALRGSWPSVPSHPQSRLPDIFAKAVATLRSADREELCHEIEADVARWPLRTPVHELWLELWRNTLPGRLRSELRDYPQRVSQPWLVRTIPIVSARARRVDDELVCLLAKSRAVIAAVSRQAALSMAALAIGSLTHRRGVSYRATVAAIIDMDRVTLADRWCRNDALVETARRGLAQATTGARDDDHFLRRLRSFLLAVALGAQHHYEARGLAYACRPRDGKRLLRFHRLLAPKTDSAAADGARDLLLAALKQTPSQGVLI